MEKIKYRKIPSLDFRYEISRSGELRNIKSKKVLKPRVNAGGYLQVNCSVNKTNPNYKPYGYVTKQIHKLVMEAWGPAMPSDETYESGLPIWVVDHRDKNKQNNHISNLRWLSWSENSKNTERSYGYLSHSPNHHKFCFEVAEKATGEKYFMNRFCEVSDLIISKCPQASKCAVQNGIYRGYSHGFYIKKIPLNA